MIITNKSVIKKEVIIIQLIYSTNNTHDKEINECMANSYYRFTTYK